jgi:hypothetical protein
VIVETLLVSATAPVLLFRERVVMPLNSRTPLTRLIFPENTQVVGQFANPLLSVAADTSIA